jgi:hypothetical protein
VTAHSWESAAEPPLGGEGSYGVDRPPPAISLEQLLADQINPYINWGDGSSGSGGGLSVGGGGEEIEPIENTLIDPPGTTSGGGEGGLDDHPDWP